jgi:hypothetical protein
MTALSNADALLVAVPMIGTLVVGYFRLDELFGKPRKRQGRGHQLAGMDDKGRVTCLDPDGTAVTSSGAVVTPTTKGVVRRERPQAERVSSADRV